MGPWTMRADARARPLREITSSAQAAIGSRLNRTLRYGIFLIRLIGKAVARGRSQSGSPVENTLCKTVGNSPRSAVGARIAAPWARNRPAPEPG